jgi:lipid-binding SYLF domain-containing protein
MRCAHRIFFVLCWVAVSLAGTATTFAAKGTLEEQRQSVRTMRDEALTELYKQDASVRQKINKAEGYAVFSNIGVNLIFASVAGGKGVVVDRKGKEVFMKMASGGFGLGLGIKDFRAVFVFRTKQRLAQFIEKGWDFGARADAAAQSGEKGGAAAGAVSALSGVDVYQITKNGLALQATLQGTKYWRDAGLNN